MDNHLNLNLKGLHSACIALEKAITQELNSNDKESLGEKLRRLSEAQRLVSLHQWLIRGLPPRY